MTKTTHLSISKVLDLFMTRSSRHKRTTTCWQTFLEEYILIYTDVAGFEIDYQALDFMTPQDAYKGLVNALRNLHLDNNYQAFIRDNCLYLINLRYVKQLGVD